MIGVILMFVQVKSGTFFFSLYLLVMNMIATMHSFLFEPLYHIGMIIRPVFFIPDGIAVKIAGGDVEPFFNFLS